MTHRSCREWGKVPIGPGRGEEGGYSRTQADALLAAAAAHPAGGRDGAEILYEANGALRARQVVGVLAVSGASLKILPKVDEAAAQEPLGTVRARLVHMLDVALGLDLATGGAASLARQDETLLDVLIRLFAQDLLDQVRRGLPRLYRDEADDLPALRGRLDVVRQFTVHAVRPDRLACRFDSLAADTPLMRVMKACVLLLARHARAAETVRLLGELRHALADVPTVSPARLPWDAVRIDRSNRQWRRLFDLARLFLGRHWQATHHEAAGREGLTLLFPMNDLFEAYVAAQLRQALAGSGIEVVAQGGLRHCLGEWDEGMPTQGRHFLTRPDLILRRPGQRDPLMIIDTKWKRLDLPDQDRPGVAQGDIYQMMAYARLYRCPRLMLLYPATAGQGTGEQRVFGLAGGTERLSLATVDLAAVPASDGCVALATVMTGQRWE